MFEPGKPMETVSPPPAAEQRPPDPSVAANPPASASDNPPQPQAREPKAEGHPKEAAMPKNKNNKPNRKPPNKVTEEAVLSRARRMMRSQMKKVAQVLGMEEYDEAKFNEKVDELAKAQEEKKSVLERFESRASNLDEENKELRQKIAELDAQLAKERGARESLEHQIETSKLEGDIREAAVAAGIRDVDYGIELFKRHCREIPDEQEDNVDPTRFFEDLKKDPKRRAIFTEETVPAHPPSAAERLAGNKTIPQGAPQGDQPTTPSPAPKPAGGQPGAEVIDALSMNPRQFADHSSQKYGYRPGS